MIHRTFENLVRENEEFLISFELCKEDLSHQVKSLLFQLEKIRKLHACIEELSYNQLQGVIQYSSHAHETKESPLLPDQQQPSALKQTTANTAVTPTRQEDR